MVTHESNFVTFVSNSHHIKCHCDIITLDMLDISIYH